MHCQLRIPRKWSLKANQDLRNDFHKLMFQIWGFRAAIQYQGLEKLQRWAAPEDIDTAPTFNPASTFNATTTSLRAKLQGHMKNLDQLYDFVFRFEERYCTGLELIYESIMRVMEKL